MTTVAVYELSGKSLSHKLCEAMSRGIARSGERVIRRNAESYVGPEADVAVFYGFIDPLQRAMADYRSRGGAVYLDLAYWGRDRHYKVSVNDRHPTAYFQKRKHDHSRAAAHGEETRLKPWRPSGRHILLAGLSPKASEVVERMPRYTWERDTIARLHQLTGREIVYRPKPSDKTAKPIPGSRFSDPANEPLSAVMKNAHAVVVYHSNVAVDGIVAGVPAFAKLGVATALSERDVDLDRIEAPKLVNDEARRQWVDDIAWCQWTMDEMADGSVWRHLKSEGLIP